MTDTSFYDRMDELAQRLLNKFGLPATVRRVELSKPDANGLVTRANVDAPGLAVETSNKVVVSQLKQDVAKVFIFKGPMLPSIGDTLIREGLWKVIDLKKVSPEGSRVIITFVGCVAP